MNNRTEKHNNWEEINQELQRLGFQFELIMQLRRAMLEKKQDAVLNVLRKNFSRLNPRINLLNVCRGHQVQGFSLSNENLFFLFLSFLSMGGRGEAAELLWRGNERLSKIIFKHENFHIEINKVHLLLRIMRSNSQQVIDDYLNFLVRSDNKSVIIETIEEFENKMSNINSDNAISRHKLITYYKRCINKLRNILAKIQIPDSFSEKQLLDFSFLNEKGKLNQLLYFIKNTSYNSLAACLSWLTFDRKNLQPAVIIIQKTIAEAEKFQRMQVTSAIDYSDCINLVKQYNDFINQLLIQDSFTFEFEQPQVALPVTTPQPMQTLQPMQVELVNDNYLLSQMSFLNRSTSAKRFENEDTPAVSSNLRTSTTFH